MRPRSLRHAIPTIVSLVLSASPALAIDPPPPPPASAPRATRGEVEVSYGLYGGASNWIGDVATYPTALIIGFRLFGIVTPYVGGALGYGAVDQRLLTRLSIGASVGYTIAHRFRPRAFVAVVHQHEESLAAVAQQPFGAVLGIGTGIRHRAGTHFGVGFDFIAWHGAGWDVSIGPDVSAMYLTYSSGPSWYLLAGGSIAGHFRLF
jgi:hypothetical protein